MDARGTRSLSSLSRLWLAGGCARASSQVAAARSARGAALALLHRAAPPAASPPPAGAQWFLPVGAPLASLSAPQSELQPGNREDAEPHRSPPPPARPCHREFLPRSPGEFPFTSPPVSVRTVHPGRRPDPTSVQRGSVSTPVLFLKQFIFFFINVHVALLMISRSCGYECNHLKESCRTSLRECDERTCSACCRSRSGTDVATFSVTV